MKHEEDIFENHSHRNTYMNSVFFTAINLSSTEGIYKKVIAEASAINKHTGHCWLVHTSNTGSCITDLGENRSRESEDTIFESVVKLLNSQDIQVIYIRHMVPSIKLVKLLRKCHRKHVKVYYEIPTYPYYGEQIKASRNKLRTLLRLSYETLFWPIIYSSVDHLVVIKSKKKARMYKKMVCISNGVDPSDLHKKQYNQQDTSDTISMVAVGTIYPYHGYDRILLGLQQYKTESCGKKVEIHFVGESDTMTKLKQLTQDLGLDSVCFHGVKTTEELNQLYEQFDIGLGCLALHRRNADIDTTLKIIEYYCRSVPVVTSGESPMDVYHPEYTIHIEDSDNPVDIADLVRQYNDIPGKSQIWETACSKFSWDNIFKDLFESTGLLEIV